MLFPVSLSLFSALLTWALCVPPTSSFWFRSSHSHPVHANRRIRNPSPNITLQTRTSAPIESMTSSPSPTLAYNFSLTTISVIIPTPTSQSMIVTSIIPQYEVCLPPSSNSSSCSPVFSTKITSSCSAVLTYAFTAVTVSDCNQSITFSTQNSYSLVTASATVTAAPSTTGLVGRDVAAITPSSTPTTYVQSIVTYYISPWQSLLANTPSNITVRICKTDLGQQACTTITEVWVVVTEQVPVTETRDISISTSFASVRPLPYSCSYLSLESNLKQPVVLLLGPTQALAENAGVLILQTSAEYSYLSTKNTTSTSTLGQTSPTAELTTTLTTTVTVTGSTTTITKTLSQGQD